MFKIMIPEWLLNDQSKSKQKDIENFKTEPFKIIGDTCLYEIHF